MLRLAIMLVAIPAVFGQLATDVLSKAPPPIDEALRARINEFYTAHVDGSAAALRRVEQIVAEDSKDIFYIANKPKYADYEIQKIEYSDNFTKAKATVVCKMQIMNPAFAGKLMPMPQISFWKVIDGKWYWYIDPDMAAMTPFGKMKGGPAGSGAKTAELPPLPDQETAMRTMVLRVKADKSAVRIDPSAPFTGQVTVTNQMPGEIHLAVLSPKVAGLEMRLDKTAVSAGGQSVVTLRFTPPKPAGAGIPPTVDASVEVKETGQRLPIQITFGK